MAGQYHAQTISGEDFQMLVHSYSEEVPDKLAELEKQRLVTIPEAFAGRNPSYLTKAEVQTLVDWKLYVQKPYQPWSICAMNLATVKRESYLLVISAHGTFRPSLQKLVASNSAESVEEITKAAYEIYGREHSEWAQATAKLAELRGVGPAAASLLLSVYDSENIPFFSDELFRWVMFEDAKGRGWDRKMKYSKNEYKEMFPLVNRLRDRLGTAGTEGGKTSALDAEMAAYVLGKRQCGGTMRGRAKRGPETSPEGGPAHSDAKQCPLKKRKLRSSG
jgi:hypothetical protein